MSRILVVEDQPDVLEILAEGLRDAGYEVLCASTAARAREILLSETVDLLLSDWILGSESGRSLGDRASQLGIPSILTTGDPARLAAATEATFPLLAKPFRLAELQELVARTLAVAAAEAETRTPSAPEDRPA